MLIGVLLPALSRARAAARGVACLSNIRQLELGNQLYLNSNKEFLIDSGLAHGGSVTQASVRASWPVQLHEPLDGPPPLRSPVDKSPYWPVSQGGQSSGMTLQELIDQVHDGLTPDLSNLARWTSYGLNNWTSRRHNPGQDPREPFDRLAKIDSPSKTVHFLMMTFGDDGSSFARSDHVHAEGWSDAGDANAPSVASGEVQIDAHGGPRRSAASVSNFAFLDGSARALRFGDVYRTVNQNSLNPLVAR